MFSDFIQERTVYRFVLGMDMMHMLDFNGKAYNQDLTPSIPSSKFTMLVQLLYCICLVATLGNLVLTEPLHAINVFQEVRWLIGLVDRRHKIIVYKLYL